MNMKYANKRPVVLASAMMLELISSSTMAGNRVYDEASLQQAISQSNVDSSITHIIFKENIQTNLTALVAYNGVQPLTLICRGTTVDGSAAGNFFDGDLSAVIEGSALVFSATPRNYKFIVSFL